MATYSRYCYHTSTALLSGVDLGKAYYVLPGEGRASFNQFDMRPAHIAEEVLFPVNQAALKFFPHKDGFLVQMKTFTPNFAGFYVQVDEGAWQGCRDEFIWRLHRGRNSFMAKSVNKFGVDGYVSRVVVEVGE